MNHNLPYLPRLLCMIGCALCLAALFPEMAGAQGFVDLKHSGGDGYDGVGDFALLPSGESYMVGRFSDFVQFGGQGLGFLGAASNGNNDGFVAKIDATGNALWAKAVGGKYFDKAEALAVHPDGGLFVAGCFSDTVAFETATLLTGGPADQSLFVARYDAAGNELWVRQLVVSGGFAVGGLGCDNDGNLFLAANFGNRISVVPGSAGADFTYETNGSNDLLLAKYSPDGELLWANHWGGPGNDEFSALESDASGGCYAGGFFGDTLQLGGDQLLTEGGQQMFVARFTGDGDLVWSRRSEGGGTAAAKDLVLQSGKLYICGDFGGNVLFEGESLQAAGGTDVFVAQMTGLGDLEWMAADGGANIEQAAGMAVADGGGVWLAGHFYYDTTFGDLQMLSAGENDAFIAHYDNNGNFEWVRRGGGGGYDTGVAIGADASGLSYLVGNFTSDFSIADTSIVAENLDIFMLLSTSCDLAASAPSASSNSPICAGDTLLVQAGGDPGNTYLWAGPNDFSSNGQSFEISETYASQSGSYTVVTENDGCPGLPDVVEVEIYPSPSPSIIGSLDVNPGDTVTYFVANDSLSVYGWDLLGGSFLEGVSDSSVVHLVFGADDEFTAQLCVTQQNSSGCVASDCILINVGEPTGIGKPAPQPGFEVHFRPNPAFSVVEVELDMQAAQPAELLLLTLSGKVVGRRELPPAHVHKAQLSVDGLPSGIYVLQIKTPNSVLGRKLVVQR